MLGVRDPLPWHIDSTRGLVVAIPEYLQTERARPCRQAYVLKIEPVAD
jgi:hypothetical protein